MRETFQPERVASGGGRVVLLEIYVVTGSLAIIVAFVLVLVSR